MKTCVLHLEPNMSAVLNDAIVLNNLKSQISPEDIQWEGEDPGILHRAGHGGSGRGNKKSTGPSGTIPAAGRGRGALKNNTKNNFPPSQNGIGKKGSDDMEIYHTDSVIKEVCVFIPSEFHF